jgi:hypothetical protein
VRSAVARGPPGDRRTHRVQDLHVAAAAT